MKEGDLTYPAQAFDAGEPVAYRGQRFWPIARRPKEAKGGSRVIDVDFWEACCADCGARYGFDLLRPYDLTKPFRPVRRCEAHRRKGGKPITLENVHPSARG